MNLDCALHVCVGSTIRYTVDFDFMLNLKYSLKACEFNTHYKNEYALSNQ